MSRRTLLAGLLLVLAVFLAFLPAARGGFLWDDEDYVVDNPALRSAGGLADIWLRPGYTPQYYPLVFTSFWIEYHLWGARPAGYHLVNIILHALNALLLWALLARLGLPGAWLAAALFALHPVQVETVAWIAERKNLLSGFFALLSALAWFRFAGDGPARSDGEEQPKQGGWGWFALALLLFLAALLAKTVVATLPLALAAIVWWRRGRLARREAGSLSVLAAAGVLLALVTIRVEHGAVGASGAPWDFSPMERLLIAGRALWFYLGKLAWPAGLSFIYPRWQPDAGDWRHYLFLLAAALAAAGLLLGRRRLGRAPLAAALCWGVLLAPALGFVSFYPMLYSFVADHFQYLAAAPLLALVAAGLAALAPRPGFRGRLARTAFVMLPLALGLLACRRAVVFRDAELVWRDALAKNPASWMARSNLGRVLAARDRPGEAEASFRESLRLEPFHPEGWFNLGEILARQGRWPEAARAYRVALDQVPMYADAQSGLGVAMAALGQPEEAEQRLLLAARLKPAEPEPPRRLGRLLLDQGRAEEAALAFTEALELAPDDTATRAELGRAYLAAGMFRDAEAEFRRALSIDPSLPAAREGLDRLREREAGRGGG